MITRLASLLLKSACVAAVVFGMSAPSSACWFPFCWHGYSAYRPAYPAYYGPGCCAPSCSPCGSACSPCGPGGCGVRTYYGPVTGCSTCGCSPCGCDPCGFGCSPCGDGCGIDVGYNPDPVRDNSAAAGGREQTYAPEEESSGTVTDEPPEPAPGDDDFEPAGRENSTGTDSVDPFVPPVERETGTGDAAAFADPQPLNLDHQGVTLRMMPTRQRVHAEARYRVPRIVRLELAPESPWQPVRENPAHVASN